VVKVEKLGVFADYKAGQVSISGEYKKEFEYLIPKPRVDYFDEKEVS
jgi:hypothetical protein